MDRAAAGTRQIFVGVTTARIPADQVERVLGAERPTSPTKAVALTADRARALLASWQADPAVRVVQAPKVLAQEGQGATVSIGETITFARSEVHERDGGLAFEIVNDPAGPVFIGYELRLVARPDAEGLRIALDLPEQQRQLLRDYEPDEVTRAGAKKLLQSMTLEQRLDVAFEIVNGGHALIGSPQAYEDEDGRFLRVSIVSARLVGDDGTSG